MKKWFLWCLLSSSFMTMHGAENLLKNGDFESGINNWSNPKYYGGIFESVKDKTAFSGRAHAKLTSTDGRGKIIQMVLFRAIDSRSFVFKIQARGQGSFRLGILEYAKNAEGKLKAEFRYSDKTYPLTGEWTNYEYRFDIDHPKISQIAVLAEISGKDSVVELDAADLQSAASTDVKLSVTPAHAVLAENTPFPNISVRLEQVGKATASTPILWATESATGEKSTDLQGEIQLNEADIAADVTWMQLLAGPPSSRVAKQLFIDRIPENEYREFQSLAQSIKLKKPLRILYLGDSLSDFERGHNYADKVDFFLNRHNQSNFRNAGVAGDYITRMLARMEGMENGKAAFRQEQYADLWSEPYDLIFIFLGHNDTKTKSKEDFTTPLVTPEAQNAAYSQLIDIIRRNSKAKIALISSTSSNFDLIEDNCRKALEKKQPFVRFGEPAKLEAFNAELQKLAKKFDLDYLDVYTPTRNAADKSKLFSPTDGVHLTEAGNRLIAKTILTHLKESEQK